MLFACFPLYVLDGMLELCAASLHMWDVKEPVVILMEDEPNEAALAA